MRSNLELIFLQYNYEYHIIENEAGRSNNSNWPERCIANLVIKRGDSPVGGTQEWMK